MKRVFFIIPFLLMISVVWAEDSKDRLLKEAEALNQEVVGLSNEGKYREAISVAEKALAITEKALGPEHPDLATSLNELALLYETTGQYAEAESLYKRSIAILEKALGLEDPDVAASLNNLAALYQTTERYAEAEPLYKRSLAILEKALGPEHPDVATCLSNIAMLYETNRRYAEAEPLYKRSIAIREKALGPEHPDVATSLNKLAALYQTTGSYAEAEPLYKRSLAIREKALGPEHPDVAESLNNIAQLYETTGRYAEAEPLYRRSLAILEKALGPEDPDVARCLNNLALLYDATGRYAEAEPLYKRSLAIKEKALGSEHPDVALSLNNLAALYQATGRYAEAEPLYKRSLAIREKALSSEHPDVAQSLNNLAQLYETNGRYAEAEPLYKRSLAILEKALGPEHPDVALIMNNLAVLYQATGRNTEAEPLLERALLIRVKAFGPEHPDVALIMNNLAQLYQATGLYPEAEPLLKRALVIREKALGPEHPDVALSLNNLAGLYETTSRYAEAEPLYKRSLAIKEKAFGPEHPDVALSLNNLAMLSAFINNHPESHKFFLRGFSINDKEREQVFQMLSEKQKIEYMKQNQFRVQAFISHSSQYMQTAPDAVAETLNAWLRWKGSVAESQSRYMDAALYSENPDVMTKYEQLISVRRALAKLQLSKPDKLTPAQYKGQIEKLEKQKEALESELSRLSKNFALDRIAGKADINKLSEILPKDSVYIDLANIKMYNFTEKKWGKSRYLAFVLVPGKQSTVRLLDIADAEETDGHIKAYLQEMKRATLYESLPRKEVLEREAKILYGLVMKPLKPYIKDKTLIFISPDGNLNLIPFEVLMTAESRYMMEEVTINYIGAGRDIVRFTDTNVAKEQALIMADPDYDLGLKEEEIVAGELRAVKSARGAVSKDIRRVKLTKPKHIGRERDGVADLEGVIFPRLQDTKHEADAIEKILALDKKASPQNYQDKKALEEILFAARSPRMLHLATHGYFLPKEEEPKAEMQLMGKDNGRMPETKMENPMLRSGIVLAGANTSLAEGRDDGIVSAEKILGLKLRGTELVVLSACETGVGDVQTGEGVFGLKRAFILSGAKTVVMSLWSVPSKETTELMTEFYRLMSEGKKKSEALRQAKINMMAKKPNPYYWGAFVMTGKPD